MVRGIDYHCGLRIAGSDVCNCKKDGGRRTSVGWLQNHASWSPSKLRPGCPPMGPPSPCTLVPRSGPHDPTYAEAWTLSRQMCNTVWAYDTLATVRPSS